MPLIYKDRFINSRVDDKFYWEHRNPVLRKGEIGYERDTFKYKEGDGVTPYNLLDYSQFFENAYQYIQPRFEGILDNAVTYQYTNGGYIQRGNLISLSFMIKAKFDHSLLNDTDHINIILYNAPLCHAPNILLKDTYIYGIGPYNEAYAQFIEHSNIIEILVKESSLDHDYSDYQVDNLRNLKIEDIEDEYIEIHCQISYISEDNCIKRNLIVTNPIPYKENIKRVNYTITEDDLIKSVMFNTEIYLPDKTAEIPNNHIYFSWPISDVPIKDLGGIISVLGINAYNLSMIYSDNKFSLVSRLDRNTYNIDYTDLISINVRFSGIFVWIK